MATQIVSPSVYLDEVINWDGKSRHITQALAALFEAEEYPHWIEDLGAQGIEPLEYIDSLDKVREHSIRL